MKFTTPVNKPSLQALEKAGPAIEQEVSDAGAELAVATTRLNMLDLRVAMGNERDGIERNLAETAVGQANRRLERARSAKAEWEREVAAAKKAEAGNLYRQRRRRFMELVVQHLQTAERGQTLLGEIAKFCKDTIGEDQQLRQLAIELIGDDLRHHPLLPDSMNARIMDYLSGQLLKEIGSRHAAAHFFRIEFNPLREPSSSYVGAEKAVMDQYLAAIPNEPPARGGAEPPPTVAKEA